MIALLSGGVGGAKLVQGFSLTPYPLSVIVNTADDFVHWGLHISPDLDSVMYVLAQLSDPQRGWGVRDESWQALEMVKRYGGPDWFQLGDRDLGTHLMRTQALNQGQTLTQVTQALCQKLGIQTQVLPMSDNPVRTQVRTPQGWDDFQVYFVKQRCQPTVSGIRFQGIARATPSANALAAIESASLIVLCPSNPLVSLDPILQLPGMEQALKQASAPTVAVSPLISGHAVKGPTVEMLTGLGIAPSPVAIANRYSGFLDGFVLDVRDATLAPQLAALGLRVLTTNTLMKIRQDKQRLAQTILKAWMPA